MKPLAVVLLACATAVPGDGRWSPAAPLPEPIQELSAAALHGKIYVAGGIERSNHPTAAAFRYDAATNRWERIADLPAPRHHMPLAVAGDTLYAVGGLSGQSFIPERTLWAYREDVNRWETRAPLPVPRGASGAAAVGGRLVVVGGGGAGRRLGDSTAIYDPAANGWRNAAPIPTLRDHLAAPPLARIVYAIRGRPLDPDRNYDVVEAYDPATDRWTTKGPMPSRRGGLAAPGLDRSIPPGGRAARPAAFPNHEGGAPAPA